MKQRGIGKQINGNLGNVFRRTALGMLFLYFVFASYYLLGIEAVVVTSFFLPSGTVFSLLSANVRQAQRFTESEKNEALHRAQS